MTRIYRAVYSWNKIEVVDGNGESVDDFLYKTDGHLLFPPELLEVRDITTEVRPLAFPCPIIKGPYKRSKGRWNRVHGLEIRLENT